MQYNTKPSCKNHAEKSLWILLFKKRAFRQEILRNFLLIVADLQTTRSNAIKHEILTKFFTGVLKILQNILKKIRNKVPVL